MTAMGATAFAVVVWGSILVVLGVFAYVASALARDRRENGQ